MLYVLQVVSALFICTHFFCLLQMYCIADEHTFENMWK